MPAKNKIEDLRDHLFETLEALKDDEKPMDIARAKAVADVARVIVESAKVEVDFVKATGAIGAAGSSRPRPRSSYRRVRARLPANDTTAQGPVHVRRVFA
jgi:hypothetical protein